MTTRTKWFDNYVARSYTGEVSMGEVANFLADVNRDERLTFNFGVLHNFLRANSVEFGTVGIVTIAAPTLGKPSYEAQTLRTAIVSKDAYFRNRVAELGLVCLRPVRSFATVRDAEQWLSETA